MTDEGKEIGRNIGRSIGRFLKMFGIYDNGGVLRPKVGGINLVGKPEYILTEEQWKAMQDYYAAPPLDEEEDEK